MEISGKIKSLLPVQSGESKSGNTWKKQQFILETANSQYPKSVAIQIWGDNIDKFGLSEGEDVVASIDIESREFNGRWYTDVKAWKVQKTAGGASAGDGFNQEAPNFPPPPENAEEDVLPF